MRDKELRVVCLWTSRRSQLQAREMTVPAHTAGCSAMSWAVCFLIRDASSFRLNRAGRVPLHQYLRPLAPRRGEPENRNERHMT